MISFPIPDGFAIPEGVKPGAEFESVASLVDNGDGTLSIVSLDGSPVGDGEGEDDENETEIEVKTTKGSPPPDFAGAVMKELKGSM